MSVFPYAAHTVSRTKCPLFNGMGFHTNGNNRLFTCRRIKSTDDLNTGKSYAARTHHFSRQSICAAHIDNADKAVHIVD
ncbi:hypothetical protein EEC00_00505 [Neisseria gonorrhoeae]